MLIVTGCPGRMWSSCVSLKFAQIQMSSGTNIVRFAPGCAYWPTEAPSWTTRPAWSAVTVVYERLSRACSRWALACARLATALARCAFRASTCRCQLERRLRTVHRCLLLVQLRRILLRVLNRACNRLRQILIARRLL